MKYKIQRIDYAKLTQGLLRLCVMIDSSYYQPYNTKEECVNMLKAIYNEAMETTFLRRNKWEPLNSAYNIIMKDTILCIESIFGKQYLTFEIIETQ